ncbi:uncharacterized protein LOC102806063 [Saccoglossus kowalevskii]
MKRGRPPFNKTDSAKKRRRSEIQKNNRQSRVQIGNQFDRWESLRLQLASQGSGCHVVDHRDVAKYLLDRNERFMLSTPVRPHADCLAFDLDASTISRQSDDYECLSGIEYLKEFPQGMSLTFQDDRHDETYHPSSTEESEDSDLDDSDLDHSEFLMDLSMNQNGIDASQVIGNEDDSSSEVSDSDEQDICHAQPSKMTETHCIKINNPEIIISQKAGIVYESCLKQLVEMKIPEKCPEPGCKKPYEIDFTKIGTSLTMEWVCTDGHIGHKWLSQPLLNKVNAADFILSSCIVLSGNNYSKTKRLLDFMNVGCVNESTHHRIQKHYCIPEIKKYWEDLQNKVLENIKDQEVIIAGDGRMDSPGYNAQFCTYTVMEYETLDIVAVIIIDKRETELKSTNMEKEAFKRAMDFLKEKGIKVKEVISDAHPQVTAFMKRVYPEVKHSYDIWHAAKNLGKKINKVGQEKGNNILLAWSKDIVNHFWFCSRECSGSPLSFLSKWKSVLFHITNQHEWPALEHDDTGCCAHGPITEGTREKDWLTPSSKPHVALRKLIYDNYLLQKIPYYVNFRTTAELENFQELILVYSAKRYSFSWQRQYCKKSQRWTVTHRKTEKSFFLYKRHCQHDTPSQNEKQTSHEQKIFFR